MKIVEISKAEFDNFSESERLNTFVGSETYFCNGCYFDDKDNLLAFSFYDSYDDIPSKYFKVVNDVSKI